MFVLKFANGEYLHSVDVAPFHYTRTTELADASIYYSENAARLDASLVFDETGHMPERVESPMTYEVTRTAEGYYRMEADARVMVTLVMALRCMADVVERDGHTAAYRDFATLRQNLDYVISVLPVGERVTQNGHMA